MMTSVKTGLLESLNLGQKVLTAILLGSLFVATVVHAGNGIERTSDSVDFSQGVLPSHVQEASMNALTDRCGGALEAADSVTLVSVHTEKVRVDQGLEDAVHTLTFDFLKDSAPRRSVVVVVKEFDVLSSNASAQIVSVRGIVCR